MKSVLLFKLLHLHLLLLLLLCLQPLAIDAAARNTRYKPTQPSPSAPPAHARPPPTSPASHPTFGRKSRRADGPSVSPGLHGDDAGPQRQTGSGSCGREYEQAWPPGGSRQYALHLGNDCRRG
ncbi:uncharacterized protein A4U43_C08F3480 [Asparagus officinalis]|nr:uncharacterized protein A4U43_C08F3480 [Asparagus officinalis]